MTSDFDYARRLFSTVMDALVNSRGDKSAENPRSVTKPKFRKDRLHDALVLAQVPRDEDGSVRNADAARYLGKNPQTTFKWLDRRPGYGTVNISAADLFKIADKLKVSAEWLMSLTDDPTPTLTIGPDERRVLAVFAELRKLDNDKWADDWIAGGYKTLENLGVKPSQAVPFPAKTSEKPRR